MTNSNLKFENNPAPGDKSSGFVIAPGPGFSIFGGYMRGLFREKNPAWNGGIRNGQDGRIFILKPEHYRADINGYVLRSVLLAEKALGGPIPNGALVHHFDGNPANDHKNLILCENNKYHHLLHQRKRAYDACGRADWRKCRYCKRYDNPANLYISPGRGLACHKYCKNKYERERYHKAKEL